MDANKLMEKVNKLLALAGNNPSEEEAKSAALKAQELIARYNLDMSALGGEEKIQYKLIKATHPNNNGYRSTLAVTLAQNFRCRTVLIGQDIHFFGRDIDAQACTEVFNTLYVTMRRAGQRQERLARKEGRSAHGVFNSYVVGFLKGLKDELDSQSKALMIIVPEDVKDEFHKKFPNLAKGTRFGTRNNLSSSSAFRAGYSDGRNSMKTGQLEAAAN